MSRPDDVKSVACPYCSAAVGRPCVYTEGPFRGSVKMSGPHSQRFAVWQPEAPS